MTSTMLQLRHQFVFTFIAIPASHIQLLRDELCYDVTNIIASSLI